MEWDILGTSYSDIFLRYLNGMSQWDLIGMLFLEYRCCSGVILGAIFENHI